MALPRGFVVNSHTVSDDIHARARNPLSPHELHALWKGSSPLVAASLTRPVYTTTSRRLLDPTARRLENLFWRVWGAPDCAIASIAVAAHFASISSGEAHPRLGRLACSAATEESCASSVRLVEANYPG
jgi:hypothetical protein